MEVLTASQIRAWDQYTIDNEPVSSIELMERAATACFNWIRKKWNKPQHFTIFCGKGNNGGDGLALARMLHNEGYPVEVNILEFGHPGTQDFQYNLHLLHQQGINLRFISSSDLFPNLLINTIIIDALLGTGLNRPVEGLTADLIKWINKSGKQVIAIDIPSGLATDTGSEGNTVLHSTYTISFQCYKFAFLFPENEKYTGEVNILDIGLLKNYLQTLPETRPKITAADFIRKIIRPRSLFSHKGNFGHALIIAGSKGKAGAAVLASRACIHSGAGLVTAHVPAHALPILQVAIPEAMVIPDIHPDICTENSYDLSGFDTIAIGPGLGKMRETSDMLKILLEKFNSPVVLDADALNIISANREYLKLIPSSSVLTPHIKEFERLFGKSSNGFERLEKAKKAAETYKLNIVLKGKFSAICTEEGEIYFNPTGNPGMATGGSGDVLTGIMAAFLSKGIPPRYAAIAAVYIHGLAGDITADENSQEFLTASLLIENLGKAFIQIQKKSDFNPD